MKSHRNNGCFQVCEPGALRHPLKDILVLTKPEENLALIMKDGKIYENTVN